MHDVRIIVFVDGRFIVIEATIEIDSYAIRDSVHEYVYDRYADRPADCVEIAGFKIL